MTSKQAAVASAAIGAAVVTLTTVPFGLTQGLTALLASAAFAAWALVPYLILLAVGPRTRRHWAVLGAGAAALAVEVGIRLSVMVFPRGSTAAIALVFSPAFILLVAMPLGAVAGWLVGRAVASRWLWLRLTAVATSLALLALTVLGLARPELFPTTVYTRQQTLDRIGAPGVRVGADRFETVAIGGPAHGWYLAGEFDGRAGDEVAIVAGEQLQLFDVPSLQPRDPLRLAGETARWSWFSQPVWSGGALRRVDGGGGFQETQVFALDGTQIFRYHPDPRLPPNALRAADLDEDGDADFYASGQRYLARLTADGRELWQRPMNAAQIISLHAATAVAPAWVVAQAYGQPLTIWTPRGDPIATVPAAEPLDRPVIGVFDWHGQRVIAYGGERLALHALDGATVFTAAVADMRVAAAWTVRFTAAGPSYLVVQSTADRDTHRARLQLLDDTGTLAYDEVSEQMPRIVIARAADGTSLLLVARGDGSGLQRLAPRGAGVTPS